MFLLKDKVDHYSCVIYRGDSSCDQNYIGETVRNAKIRWNEHEDKNSKSEPVKHLKENPTYKFTWNIISKVPEYCPALNETITFEQFLETASLRCNF